MSLFEVSPVQVPVGDAVGELVGAELTVGAIEGEAVITANAYASKQK